MEAWIAAFAVAVTIVGGIAALAYRSRRWGVVRDGVSYALAGVLGVVGFTGIGLLLAKQFPKQASSLFTAASVICAGAVGLLLLVWVADWLRNPER